MDIKPHGKASRKNSRIFDPKLNIFADFRLEFVTHQRSGAERTAAKQGRGETI